MCGAGTLAREPGYQQHPASHDVHLSLTQPTWQGFDRETAHTRGQECPRHTLKQKEKAIEMSLNGLYFMPTTTAVYSVLAEAPSEAEGEVEGPSRVGIVRVGRTFLSDVFESCTDAFEFP
jgi:hypothetical protein